MRRAAALLGCVLGCLLVAGGARTARAEAARIVSVRVLEIAGSQAYLSAGSAQGLRVGTRVRFGSHERRVEKTSRSFAVVSARRLRVGDRGTARTTVREGGGARLTPPRPLSAFEGQWPQAVLPASQQTPSPVRLGPMEAKPSRVDATLAASGAAFLPLDGETEAVGRGELRARVLATPVDGLPLTLSGDVAVQRWFGRYATGVASGDPRPWLRVRELSVSLGDPDGYRAQVGRLRYAAANLGPIDGGRFEAARWGPVRIAGFGGLLPDPIDGRLARGAGRFGLELDVRGARPSLHHEVTLVLQGSVFDGKLDERRVYAQAQLWPGDHRVGAYAETSVFDSDNPWGRPSVDVTSAGADFDLRFGDGHIGARFDMRKPERSYWLDSAFPRTWLCSSATALTSDVPCTGSDDTRYVAQGFGGMAFPHAQIDVGGSWVGSSEPVLGQHGLGHATVRFPQVGGRYDLALGGSHEGGSLISSSSAARGEVGVGLLDEVVRLSVYYRPAYRRYRASLEGLWEHGAGAGVHVAPSPAFALDLRGDARLGDVDVAVVMLMLMYRAGR